MISLPWISLSSVTKFIGSNESPLVLRGLIQENSSLTKIDNDSYAYDFTPSLNNKGVAIVSTKHPEETLVSVHVPIWTFGDWRVLADAKKIALYSTLQDINFGLSFDKRAQISVQLDTFNGEFAYIYICVCFDKQLLLKRQIVYSLYKTINLAAEIQDQLVVILEGSQKYSDLAAQEKEGRRSSEFNL